MNTELQAEVYSVVVGGADGIQATKLSIRFVSEGGVYRNQAGHRCIWRGERRGGYTAFILGLSKGVGMDGVNGRRQDMVSVGFGITGERSRIKSKSKVELGPMGGIWDLGSMI